jgi:NTE family protein
MNEVVLRSQHAFVLSGGGSLGAVQAGMLAELIASGVQPDLVVGVSAGALNGAFLAFDPSSSMTERMIELWKRVRTRDVLPLSLSSLLGLVGRRGHLASPDGLRTLLERELPFSHLGATRIPLHIVAAEQRTGEEVLISVGDVVQAILASAAIPGIFPAVTIDGRNLVDGVVATGTPIATAVRLGSTEITIVPCGFTCVENAVPRHAIGRAMHAITLLGARQLRADFARFADQTRLRVVPPLCPLQHSSYDYSNGAALTLAARKATRQWLDAGGLDKRGFPGELEPHHH